MSEDEVAAVHEAAHAAFAVFGPWTKLAGRVSLDRGGCGDVVMSTDGEAIGRTIAADPNFDRDLPRIELVRALLAGPIAERILAERGSARLSEDALDDAGRGDYDVVFKQLAQLDPPRAGLLEQLEVEVRERLEQPEIWAAIERFAAILLRRRRLEAGEATSILGAIREGAHARELAAGESNLPQLVIAMTFVAAVLWLILS